MSNLLEMAVGAADKQRKMVDELTKNNALLQTFDATAASHGSQNVYEKVSSVTGGSIVDMNEAAPTVAVETDLYQEDVSLIKGEDWVTEDDLEKWGLSPAQYFEKRSKLILPKTGSNISFDLIYNHLENYAVTNGNWINAGGTTATSQTSILAVRMETEGTSLVYNPSQGMTIANWLPIDNFNPQRVTNADGGSIWGYGARLRGQLGYQIVDPSTVAVIKNIESGKTPSEENLDDLLELAGIDKSGTVKLYTSLRGLNLTSRGIMGDMVRVDQNTKGLDYILGDYSGVPFIVDQNFIKTEAVQS